MIPSNAHLKYAFIEAGWTAARVSPYFSGLYDRLKERKGACKAAGAVARRLCEIAYFCLKEKRVYEERPYKFRKSVDVAPDNFGRVALINA